MMLKLLVLTFLRISEITQAMSEQEMCRTSAPNGVATTGTVGAKSQVIPLAISGMKNL